MGMKNPSVWDRIFVGIFPGGIVYADRKREKHGDYARLAFLPYDTLVLKVEKDCPPQLREAIEADAKTYQARKGERMRLDSHGHASTILGSRAE